MTLPEADESADGAGSPKRGNLYSRRNLHSNGGRTVRLRFQERPWDLIVVLIYTILASIVLLAFGKGVIWAILLVLFVPGYVVVAALFPGHGLSSHLRELAEQGEELLEAARSLGRDPKPYRNVLAQAREAAARGRVSKAIGVLEEGNQRLRADLLDLAGDEPGAWSEVLRPPSREEKVTRTVDWPERITLSFGLAIAITSLLGLLLNLTPSGIRLDSITVAILLFTVFVGLVAIARRIQLPVEDRLSATIAFTLPSRDAPAVDKILTLGLAMSIVFAGGMVVYVAVTPRPTEQFTQFFLLDRTGGVDRDLYPFNLNVSEPGTVIMVIVNNESLQVHYTIRVDLVGVERVFNPTTRDNETVERNRTVMDRFTATVDDRGSWRLSYAFTIDAPGTCIVNFLLFRDGNYQQPYRSVELRVRVPRPP